MSTLAESLAGARQAISRAASSSGRLADSIQLVVVTKNHPVSLPIALAGMGQLHFGENRDQEASAKAAEFSAALPEVAVDWHFIGQLQTNKVKSVVQYASHLHSLDRPSLLAELIKQLDKHSKTMQVFIELNLTDDPNRGGVMPSGLLTLADAVLQAPSLKLRGLMAVAGLDVDPKSDFERVLELQQSLLSLDSGATDLSMGMSADFEVAISMGATHVRIGSAITGPRPQLT